MKAIDPVKKLEQLEAKRRALHKEIMSLMNDYGHLLRAGREALGTSTSNLKHVSKQMRQEDTERPEVKAAKEKKKRREMEMEDIEKAKKRRRILAKDPMSMTM
jgi:hypothetical protein